MDVSTVRADLIAEQGALDDALAGCSEEMWAKDTASPGWTVADQIGHLTYFDTTAAVAITDPPRFKELVGELWNAAGSGSVDDFTLAEYRSMSADELNVAWREARAQLANAAAGLDDADRVDWYGPSMGAKSFLTARLMECWAHGIDVIAAVDAPPSAPTDRLHHIARLGFITRGWSYVNRKLEAPNTPVRVELQAPSGEQWNFGDDGATESVSGSGYDFCRVVTQRVHVDDTDLAATPAAREWLLIAQAFAGPPTDGPSAVNARSPQ